MRTTTTLARVNANHGDVAQLVEHWPEESGVEGSSPSVPTRAVCLPESKGIDLRKNQKHTQLGVVGFGGLVCSCQERSWKVSL